MISEGYLNGWEDYYTHSFCYRLGTYQDTQSGGHDPHPLLCGHDLRDNERVVNNYTQVYSTHMFTERATNIIDRHASQHATTVFILILFPKIIFCAIKKWWIKYFITQNCAIKILYIFFYRSILFIASFISFSKIVFCARKKDRPKILCPKILQ